MCYKEFIADHVTFSQSGGGFVVAESFQTFANSRELLCKWLEKAIVRRVITSLGKQKGRQNVESCFIYKAVTKRLLDSCQERKGCCSNRCPAP